MNSHLNTSRQAFELVSPAKQKGKLKSGTLVNRLRRRDHRSLLLFTLSSTVLVGGGEWAAFHLKMVERYGIEPVLIRAAVYIILSLLLWAFLLRNNRKHISILLKRSETYFRSLLYAYEEALGLKDSYTGGHGRRVARYSKILTNLLELPQEQSTHIEQAALLHDIGKIGVPDTVLTKPSALTPEEWTFIRGHPGAGAALLKKIETLHMLAPIVRSHHERYNGSGYPDGLAGDTIPFGAQIISIADTLDAITTSRSYRSAATFEKAIEEIERSTGTYFEPRLMEQVLTQEGTEALEREYISLKENDSWQD